MCSWRQQTAGLIRLHVSCRQLYFTLRPFLVLDGIWLGTSLHQSSPGAPPDHVFAFKWTSSALLCLRLQHHTQGVHDHPQFWDVYHVLCKSSAAAPQLEDIGHGSFIMNPVRPILVFGHVYIIMILCQQHHSRAAGPDFIITCRASATRQIALRTVRSSTVLLQLAYAPALSLAHPLLAASKVSFLPSCQDSKSGPARRGVLAGASPAGLQGRGLSVCTCDALRRCGPVGHVQSSGCGRWCITTHRSHQRAAQSKFHSMAMPQPGAFRVSLLVR